MRSQSVWSNEMYAASMEVEKKVTYSSVLSVCASNQLPAVQTGARRGSATSARYNVSAARRATHHKVSAMVWAAVLVSCAVAAAGSAGGEVPEVPKLPDVPELPENPQVPEGLPIPRSPPRTLDRQDSELAWKNWLQSPESGSLSSPPRRITTKSLFITPLVCPKGQRLDRNGCVQVVTVNKDEHERILLEQLNALFTSAPGDVLYDYDEEPGPLQLSLPVNLEPQAEPLKAPDPSLQVHVLNAHHTKYDKKGESLNTQPGYDAELELLKLKNHTNKTMSPVEAELFSQALSNFLPHLDSTKLNEIDKDSIASESAQNHTEGQKEVIYGQINVDPIDIKLNFDQKILDNNNDTEKILSLSKDSIKNETNHKHHDKQCKNASSTTTASSTLDLNIDKENHKLNPTDEYSNIGETIKLISRFAEVTTDDNYSKDNKKYAIRDDNILGTRTKLSHRRNRPKTQKHPESKLIPSNKDMNRRYGIYYRYPWTSQKSPKPPRDYPFRHIQDYWPERQIVGGVYAMHQNPKRHHHSQHPGLNRLQSYPYLRYAFNHGSHGTASVDSYRTAFKKSKPAIASSDDNDFYSLLGLKHWFIDNSRAVKR